MDEKMKTIIKITGFALMILLTGNLTLSAQFGRGLGYSQGYTYPNLPNLTDKQKTELTNLTEKHWSQMDALTKEIWGATDLEKRNAASIKLQNLRDTYWSDVIKLLTDEQKNALLLNNNYYGFGRGIGPCGAGYAFGRGRGLGVGRGIGYGIGRGRGRAMDQGLDYGMRRVW